MKSLKIFEQLNLHEYAIKLGIANVEIVLNTSVGIEIKSELLYKGVKFVLNKKNANVSKKVDEASLNSDKRTIAFYNSKILNKLLDLDISKDYDEIMYKELIKCLSEMIYADIVDQILSPETLMFNDTKEKRDMIHDIKIIIKQFIYEMNVFRLRESFKDVVSDLNTKDDLNYFLGKFSSVYKVVPKDRDVFNRKPVNLALIRSTLPYDEAMNKFCKKYREGIDKEFMAKVQKQMYGKLTTSVVPVIC